MNHQLPAFPQIFTAFLGLGCYSLATYASLFEKSNFRRQSPWFIILRKRFWGFWLGFLIEMGPRGKAVFYRSVECLKHLILLVHFRNGVGKFSISSGNIGLPLGIMPGLFGFECFFLR